MTDALPRGRDAIAVIIRPVSTYFLLTQLAAYCVIPVLALILADSIALAAFRRIPAS